MAEDKDSLELIELKENLLQRAYDRFMSRIENIKKRHLQEIKSDEEQTKEEELEKLRNQLKKM